MSDPTPFDVTVPVEFLKRWPAPPTLVAVHIDPATGEKGRIECESFWVPGELPGVVDCDWQRLADWLITRDGRANLYFHVNAPVAPIKKKAERTEMGRMVALHVDVDLRAGEDPATGIPRIIETFTNYKTRPSVVIRSGGGACPFWFLEEPVAIDGDLDRAEDAKLWNLQLERELGGDNCHDVTRIMRLPGTLNVPDTRKLKRGRVPTRSSVEWHEDTRYPIEQFTKAAPVVVKTKVAAGTSGPGASGKSDSLGFRADVAYDPVAYDDARLQLLGPEWIGLARFGDTDKKYYDGEKEDRSRALFAFCVAAAKANVPDEVVAAIITDPHWAISASVLDKKGGARKREIGRVINRARVASVNEDLERLNSKHAVVWHGGKCLVAKEMPDKLYKGRTIYEYVTLAAFRDFYNKYEHAYEYGGKLVTKPLGDYWVESNMRRQYEGITFAPGVDEEEVDFCLNLWQGLAISPEPGDKHLTFLEHVRENVCGGDETVYNYVIGWLARMFQHPELKAEVAIVMRGDKGVGKTFFADMIGALFGRHYVTVVNSDHLVGKFNAHLQDCIFMHADECLYAGDRKHEQILKTLITGKTIRVEPKGVNSFEVTNYLHLLMSSNNRHTVPAGDKERRYLAVHVKPTRIQDHAWFRHITHELEQEGGLKHLLHFLLGVDISNFEVRKVPDTDELELQKQQTRHGLDALIERLCADGVLPYAFYDEPSVALTTGASNKIGERDGFWEWCVNQSTELRYKGASVLGRMLAQDWGCETGWRRKRRGLRGVKFPPLAELRAAFEKKHGPQQWTPQEDWEPAEREWGRPFEHEGPRRDDVPPQGDMPF